MVGFDQNLASNTDLRQKAAREQIPIYVDWLLRRPWTGGLTAEHITLLYGEYRAYFRSHSSFPMHTENAVAPHDRLSELDKYTELELLVMLRAPELVNRQGALAILLALRAKITSDKHRQYALS